MTSLAALTLLFAALASSSARGAGRVENGDINGDGVRDISDPIALLGWLFLGSDAPVDPECPVGSPTLANGDANGDGSRDLSDAVHMLQWLFAGASAPAPIDCGGDLSECEAALAALGVGWQRGPATRGVVEPVMVQLPLGGIEYRFLGNADTRDELLMDCSLARALGEAATILAAHDVVEVVDLGVYNYRCIAGGTPPDCPSGVSEHAYARAIDIAALVTTGGEVYSVLEDWLINPNPTTSECPAPTGTEKDVFLHAVICDLWTSDIFSIILTPDYNADHRNHFHVDLTPGARFLR